jgi:hypothetical protein
MLSYRSAEGAIDAGYHSNPDTIRWRVKRRYGTFHVYDMYIICSTISCALDVWLVALAK